MVYNNGSNGSLFVLYTLFYKDFTLLPQMRMG